MLQESWFWVFNAVIAILLVIDLFAFHKKSHVIKVREALWMSAFWISLSMAFNVFIYYSQGTENAVNFLTAYLVEKALSVDNLFVFLLIFSYFRVPHHLLHKVLFWGIFGAIIMRAMFILFGIALIQNFHWIIYVFGGFLIFTGIKLAIEKEKEFDPKNNMVINLFKRLFPVTHEYVEDKFFVKEHGHYLATPLCLVLLAIESTDVVFAVDSIPAVIGITKDPFIVYTSNILAILGLRSLYFALSHVLTLFHYLNLGLAFILVFIGVKMMISEYIVIPIMVSLAVVAVILLISIVASILSPKKVKRL